MPCMNRPIASTNIIFCCSYFGAFAAKYGCFPIPSTLPVCAELKPCGTSTIVSPHTTVASPGQKTITPERARNVIERIARPTLVIHAANDPFVRILPETREKILANRNITYLEAEDGGHCAFVGERNQTTSFDGRWAEQEVVEFAKQFK